MTAVQAANIVRAQARRYNRGRTDTPAAALPPAPTDRPPPREAMVSGMVELGMSRAAAEAAYSRQLEAWEASRGGQSQQPRP